LVAGVDEQTDLLFQRVRQARRLDRQRFRGLGTMTRTCLIRWKCYAHASFYRPD
jgi:hypothetical protein